MTPHHSPCQVWPPLHQSPPARWPAVHPGTQNQRARWRRGGTRAGSLFQRNHCHTCKRRQRLSFHLHFNTNSTNIIQKMFAGLHTEWRSKTIPVKFKVWELTCSVHGHTNHVRGTCWDTAGQCRCHPAPSHPALHSSSGSSGTVWHWT